LSPLSDLGTSSVVVVADADADATVSEVSSDAPVSSPGGSLETGVERFEAI
jgi:hypothetical protein